MDSTTSVLRKSKSLPYLFFPSKIVDKAKKITINLRKEEKKGCTLNSCNEKAFRERFRVYQNNTNNNMPSMITNLSGKMYLSCGNLTSTNSVKPATSERSSIKYTTRRSSKMKTTTTTVCKDDTTMARPKSLQQLHDDLLPLLEAASSLSSIGSCNELTEESLLESSYSDDSNKNVLVRRGGKLRNMKHRPHSFALCDHGLVAIPENIIENSLKKRHGLYMQSLSNIQKSDASSSLKNVEEVDENEISEGTNNLNNINNNNNNNNNDIVNHENEKNKLNSVRNVENLENIAIPRRRCRSSNNNKYSNSHGSDGPNKKSSSYSELSFTKEQRKKLKQKMRDTKKSPEKSVFLGLF